MNNESIYKYCLNCNKIKKKQNKYFCSYRCKMLYQNPNPSKPKIKIVCQTCKKEFEVHLSHSKNREFCSWNCRRHTDKTKKKLSKIKTNNKNRLGAILSEKTKTKISKSSRGRKPNSGSFQKGDKHRLWKGGTSKEPYPFGFTENLKLYIKGMYHFECQLCRSLSDLMVHHIDYVKNNICLDNLICLCRSCNSKVNFNREYWKNKLCILVIFDESYPADSIKVIKSGSILK